MLNSSACVGGNASTWNIRGADLSRDQSVTIKAMPFVILTPPLPHIRVRETLLVGGRN